MVEDGIVFNRLRARHHCVYRSAVHPTRVLSCVESAAGMSAGSSLNSDSNGSGRRSRQQPRTLQACHQCRQRKIRCDGYRPACQSCLHRRVQCSWPTFAAPGGFTILEPSAYQASHGSGYPNPPQPGALAAAQPSPISTPQAFNNDVQMQPQSQAPTPESNERNQGTDSYETHPENHDRVSHLPEPKFPNAPLLTHLFDIFFARHHDVEMCSFLHMPTFDITRLISHSPFLVASILSLAALYLPSSEALLASGFDSADAFSTYYASIARSYARSLSDQPAVITIQAYLVLGLRELLYWTEFKAWMHVGSAVRMAQALRLGWEWNQRYHPRQKEIRRRTFWSCFVMDRLVFYSCARPPAIDVLVARAQLPCPENIFAFEEAYIGPCLSDVFQHLDRVPQLGILPFYIKTIELWTDVAKLHIAGGRRFFKHLPTDSAGSFFQANQMVEAWANDLPTSLEWSASNYRRYQSTRQEQAFVNMHFILQHARCVMHQEYLPQLDTQRKSSTEVDSRDSQDLAGLSLNYRDERLIGVCLSSANAITEMATMLYNDKAQDREVLRSTFVANALMTAISVQLWSKYAQGQQLGAQEASKAKADILLEMIRSWRQEWRVASAWVETVEMLYKLYELSYNPFEPGLVSNWEFAQQYDWTGAQHLLAEEAEDENGAHPGLSGGDGMDDPAAICHRLFDKVRQVMIMPLQTTDSKIRNLDYYVKTLWRHMWNYEGLQVLAGDELMSLPGSDHEMSLRFDQWVDVPT